MPRPLKFDMVFLDHLKPLYTIDLKVMEEEGLIGPVSLSWLSGYELMGHPGDGSGGG